MRWISREPHSGRSSTSQAKCARLVLVQMNFITIQVQLSQIAQALALIALGLEIAVAELVLRVANKLPSTIASRKPRHRCAVHPVAARRDELEDAFCKLAR